MLPSSLDHAEDATIDGPPDDPAAATGRADGRGRSRTIARFLANHWAVAATVVVALLVVLAVAAPLLARFDPNEQHVVDRMQGPSGRYWLGTDDLGRDLLSRLLYGGRVTLLAAGEALSIAVGIGVPLGLLAGQLRGPVDWALRAASDSMLSLPPLIVALAIVGMRGPGTTNAMLAVGIVLAPRFFRVTRAAAMAIRSQTYIEGCRTLGCSEWRIVTRHVLPNASGPLLVQISFSAGVAVIAEATLSFLGLGVTPPAASWGSMVQQASARLYESSWQLVPPSVLIALTILALSVVGDGLRDALGRDGGVR